MLPTPLCDHETIQRERARARRGSEGLEGALGRARA